MTPLKTTFFHLLVLAANIIAVPYSLANGEDSKGFQVEDPALQDCLIKAANKEKWQSPQEFTQLRCHSEGVQSLAGLEKFDQLTSLSLHNNKISEFNAEYWPQLESLTITKNQLRVLHLKNLPNLQKVYASGNRLESLVLEDLPALEIIKANNNELLTFEYQGLPQLEKIYLFDNELETMDIYQMPKIKYMFVRQNPMPDELYEEMDKLPGVTVLHDGNAEDWE